MSKFLQVTEAAISHMLSVLVDGLDDKKEKGRLGNGHECVGIGANFSLSFDNSRESDVIKPGTWCVAAVPEESTAFKAGLRPADAILEVGSAIDVLGVLCLLNTR
jgi:hypothetical protein